MKIIIISAVVLAVIFLFITARNTMKAERVSFENLPSILEGLIYGKYEDNYLGILSCQVDCVYFLNKDGKINIEYEAMIAEQVPFIDKIKTFAKANNIESEDMSYGNKPGIKEVEESQVLRLKINASPQKASEIGIKIMEEIFDNDSSTVFDIVP